MNSEYFRFESNIPKRPRSRRSNTHALPSWKYCSDCKETPIARNSFNKLKPRMVKRILIFARANESGSDERNSFMENLRGALLNIALANVAKPKHNITFS
jgi:hypothetical protein